MPPNLKVRQEVVDALIARGRFPAEAEMIVDKLITGEPDWDIDDAGFRILPFGKHKGACVNQVPRDYLIWISSQDWVREKFHSLYEAVVIWLRDN